MKYWGYKPSDWSALLYKCNSFNETKCYSKLAYKSLYFPHFKLTVSFWTIEAKVITSSFVRFTRRNPEELNALNDDNYERVIKLAFQQKRKTLKNNFKGILDDTDFLNLSIDPSIRAETLSVHKFISIENYLTQRKLSFWLLL